VYVFVRRDLPPSQAAVQACHACIEARHLFPAGPNHANLVVLGIRDEAKLIDALRRIHALGIRLQAFFEPDLGGQLTAFATEPIPGDSRHPFRRYPLLCLDALPSQPLGAAARGKGSLNHIPGESSAMTDAKVPEVHKSRFGFHPCPWEVFAKLKCLHRWYWQTVREFAAWKRWERKLPTNRVIRRWIRDASGRRVGCEGVGPRPEPTYCPAFVRHGKANDNGFVGDYQNARMPRAVAERVMPLSHSFDEIDAMFRRVASWLEANRGSR
jgi:hypothetical protein